METSPRKCVAPFYAVAVLWLAGGALVPLYEPMHYGLMAAVSVQSTYFATVPLPETSSPRRQLRPPAVRQPPPLKPPPPATRIWTRSSRMVSWPSLK